MDFLETVRNAAELLPGVDKVAEADMVTSVGVFKSVVIMYLWLSRVVGNQ